MKIVIDDRIPYIRGAAERLGHKTASLLPGTKSQRRPQRRKGEGIGDMGNIRHYGGAAGKCHTFIRSGIKKETGFSAEIFSKLLNERILQIRGKRSENNRIFWKGRQKHPQNIPRMQKHSVTAQFGRMMTQNRRIAQGIRSNGHVFQPVIQGSGTQITAGQDIEPCPLPLIQAFRPQALPVTRDCRTRNRQRKVNKVAVKTQQISHTGGKRRLSP